MSLSVFVDLGLFVCFLPFFMLPLFTGHPSWRAQHFSLVMSDFAFYHFEAYSY